MTSLPAHEATGDDHVNSNISAELARATKPKNSSASGKCTLDFSSLAKPSIEPGNTLCIGDSCYKDFCVSKSCYREDQFDGSCDMKECSNGPCSANGACICLDGHCWDDYTPRESTQTDGEQLILGHGTNNASHEELRPMLRMQPGNLMSPSTMQKLQAELASLRAAFPQLRSLVTEIHRLMTESKIEMANLRMSIEDLPASKPFVTSSLEKLEFLTLEIQAKLEELSVKADQMRERIG